MSRSLVPLFLIIVAACHGADDNPASPSSAPPTRLTFTVSGVIYDSLLQAVGHGGLVAGAHLSVNGIPVVSDAAGHYVATGVIPSPRAPVVVQHPAFERLSMTIPVGEDTTVNFNLRRRSPLITAFYADGDSTTVEIVDLQGRKTVERWHLTGATLQSASSTWTETGESWIWRPVDILTWRATLQGTAAAVEFHFAIHDVNGFMSQADCRVAGGCDHLTNAGPNE